MLVLAATSEILMIAAAFGVVAARRKGGRMARVAVVCGQAVVVAVIAVVRQPVAAVVAIVAVVRAAVPQARAAINVATKLVHRHRPLRSLHFRWNG